MRHPNSEIRIAGAGVIGLVTALVLARAGHRVTVCDPAPFGDNASGVAAGMLAPAFECALDPTAADHFEMLMKARDLWPALASSVGIALDRQGALAKGHEAWLSGLKGRLLDLGVRPRAVSDGLWVDEDWHLNPRDALMQLRAAALSSGVQFRDQDAGQGHPCELSILATGAQDGTSGPSLTPIKGHILRYSTPKPLVNVVRGETVYACPALDGCLIGATMEVGRRDRDIDLAIVAQLHGDAIKLMPELTDLTPRAAVGVRAASLDGLPLVGPWSEAVLVATGMRRNGWLLAPLVAQMIAAYVAVEDPGPWAALMAPGRFGGIGQGEH